MEKDLMMFSKSNVNKNGKRHICKECASKEKKEWRDKHKEHVLQYDREYREQHKEDAKKWYLDNYQHNKEVRQKWQTANKHRMNKLHREYYKAQKENVNFTLSKRIATAMRTALKGEKGGYRWEILVGYTVNDLKQHLERQFTAEMNWENIKDWHIDHVVPKSAFNYKSYSDIDFKKCWSLKNLQPMLATENREKSNKLIKPFQPSLALSED